MSRQNVTTLSESAQLWAWGLFFIAAAVIAMVVYWQVGIPVAVLLLTGGVYLYRTRFDREAKRRVKAQRREAEVQQRMQR